MYCAWQRPAVDHAHIYIQSAALARAVPIAMAMGVSHDPIDLYTNRVRSYSRVQARVRITRWVSREIAVDFFSQCVCICLLSA